LEARRTKEFVLALNRTKFGLSPGEFRRTRFAVHEGIYKPMDLLSNMTESKAKELLLYYTALVTIPALEDACNKVIYNPKFYTQVGSAGEHHAYPGGLIIHTAEVTDYAVKMSTMFEEADEDVIITAAIYHDFMKINEYEIRQSSTPDSLVFDAFGKPATYIAKTDYRNLVRHVAGSHAAFLMEIQHKDVYPDVVLGIEHAILAHHGRKEWGSPIEPQTVEARIVHDADTFSVKFGQGARNKPSC
jgi:3'-5' exoribonuclease